jgi:serpin B
MKKQTSQQKESANPKTMRTYNKLERRTGMNRMRMGSAVLIGLLALAIFFSFNGSAPAISPEDMADIKTVAEGNTAFAIDLYGRLKGQQGNLFFSPYSISTAFAMTYAGARGDTEKQMADVLNFALEQERLHPAFSNLESQLNALHGRRGIELNVANALWTQEDHVFLEEFMDETKKSYGAALRPVDFKADPGKARGKINRWVEKKTNGKITDLIGSGVLNPLTRLVLTNAIYFKGTWASQFKKSHTSEEPFWLEPGKSIKVPMMNQQEGLRYMENESLQVLELSYSGKELSMVVLLPREIDGLAQLESMLSTANMSSWIGNLKERKVIVSLPKFKTTSDFSLGNTLDSMGMTDAFDGSAADFSGMDGKRDLFISAVIHKAFVDVNEKGTEAAAATAISIHVTSVAPSPLVFRADHPFVFLVRHNPSGSILFLGRIVNPLK